MNKTKVKIVKGLNIEELEQSINSFIEDKSIINIDIKTIPHPTGSFNIAVIWYCEN